jgi:DDE superfamily endonuclease
VVFLSPVQAGAIHDFALLKKLLPADKQWFKGLTVRADSGFQGFADAYPCEKLFLPHKKPRGKDRTPNQKFRNKQQARKRVVVENSIGGFKRFRILSDRLRMHDLKQYDRILEVCAGLHNFQLSA